MNKLEIQEMCEEATDRVNKILGGDRYGFLYNERTWEFEFWELRTPRPQCLFPLDLNGEPLDEITDWEIFHAVQFVRRRRKNAD